MRLHVIDAIRKPCREKFQTLIENGFPKVAYSKTNGFQSYNLTEYSLAWARFLKLVDSKMILLVDPQLGVFTRKHSQGALLNLSVILNSITEQDVHNHPERFDTMFD